MVAHKLVPANRWSSVPRMPSPASRTLDGSPCKAGPPWRLRASWDSDRSEVTKNRKNRRWKVAQAAEACDSLVSMLIWLTHRTLDSIGSVRCPSKSRHRRTHSDETFSTRSELLAVCWGILRWILLSAWTCRPRRAYRAGRRSQHSISLCCYQ